jgi:hypothetical protein
MTQKICRCVRRLTVEDTCLHDVLGNIESLCESQVLWSKCPTTSSSFFIHPWLNPIVIILRSHFRSLLRFFTRPYSPKYFLHNCAGTCGHVPAIIYSRMVSGKDAYIVHYFSIFQHISAMNSAVSTACVDGFEACPYRYSKISKTELRPASLPPYKDCITKQIGNPGSVAYASWPVCLTGLTLLRLVHVPDGSSFL